LVEDPTEYFRWREAQGDVPLTLERMRDDPLYGSAFEFHSDRGTITDQMSGRDAVGAILQARSVGTLTGLPGDEKGMLVTFKLVTASDLKPPTFEGKLGSEVWVGGRSSAGNNWWQGEFSELVSAGELLTGYLATVVEFETGPRRPMIWSWYWHPTQERWRLRAVLLNNMKDFSIAPPEI